MKKILSVLITSFVFVSFISINSHCLENTQVDKKTAYITFDDGPNKNTPEILDLLSKYNMKATFFVLEDRITLHPDIVNRMLKEGHSIGLHGQSHEKAVFYSSGSSALNEINNTRHTLKDLTGYDTKLVRVPYGSKPYLTKNQYDSLVNSGYNLWDWSIDSTDTHKNATVSSIVSNTKNYLSESGNSVILFHDKQTTVKALPSVLEYLKNNNYEIKVIDQNQTPMNWWNRNFY
ncbi:polysaccharide deacetylase family protein [Paraclostridium bifermentans]|uniref:polysaccharide deacetylase family protein n=1 Tax=Paraclostridium bifermentans TaxID=1490 RepID=UPI0018AB292E|nr:polysaccharide deacetylase family protein [Paraclostridium bifermentans]